VAAQITGTGAASADTTPAPAAAAAQPDKPPNKALGMLYAPPCRKQADSYIVCFSIEHVGLAGPNFTVHIGIDVTMSRQDAQNIIDAPGQEFSATLYGEDPVFDDTLKAIPVTSSGAWDGGLSAEFDTSATAELLDEDSSDPTDEIFARVRLRIPSAGATRSFRTNNINEPFHLYRNWARGLPPSGGR
jgi:hypothetical protein